MAIIETVSQATFCDAFQRMDRMEGWTYNGLHALYDYLDEMSDDTGEVIELDVVALCCEYSQHGSAKECCQDNGYSVDLDDCEDDSEREEACLEYLAENATVIEFSGGIVVSAF